MSSQIQIIQFTLTQELEMLQGQQGKVTSQDYQKKLIAKKTFI